MTGTPSRAPSSARASPTRTFSSSDSTTHGPATRNGVVAKWSGMSVAEAGELRRPLGRGGRRPLARTAPLPGRRDEAREQGVRARGPGLELGVELAAEEPGVVGELDHLDQRAVGRQPRAPQAVLGEHVAVG